MSVQQFIDAEGTDYSVAEVCQAFEVPPSTYYARRHRPPCKRQERDAELRPLVKQVFHDSRETYGSPRVHHELVEAGHEVGKHRVARLMREQELNAQAKKKFRVCTTNSNHTRGYDENLLARDFHVDAPNQVWVGDVTYVNTRMGWVFLAVFIDLFSRRVVGWHLADHKRDELAIEALRRALVLRSPAPGLLVHTDRGSEFASANFRALRDKHGVIGSMSRKGNCWDNAVAESFFASLEKELLLRSDFQSHYEAFVQIADYIQNFYNSQRRHSYNDMLCPEHAERNFNLQQAA